LQFRVLLGFRSCSSVSAIPAAFGLSLRADVNLSLGSGAAKNPRVSSPADLFEQATENPSQGSRSSSLRLRACVRACVHPQHYFFLLWVCARLKIWRGFWFSPGLAEGAQGEGLALFSSLESMRLHCAIQIP
jgi:hypothetical protein